MNLDPKIAETIVATLKDVINHEINLFDTTGTIVASTNKSRIGTSHDGARLVIRTKQTITIDDEHSFKGAKNGINVPVMFNDAVVAVIGITGKREEVEPFGNVIKKMTEILIRENSEQMTRFDQRTRMANLVNMLKLRRHDTALINYNASLLKIDLKLPRIAIVGRLHDVDEAADINDLYPMAHARFQTIENSFFELSGQEICMFIDTRRSYAVSQLLDGMERDAQQILHCSLLFGIGQSSSTSAELWKSYDEACKAHDWLAFSHTGTVMRYEDMDLGLIVSSVPPKEAEQLVGRVFEGLSGEEIDEYQKVFDAYTRHNGSIVHCAEELYLHKNTLQNRLNKIAQKTGYNPRKLADYTVLSLAFKLRSYSRRSS